MLSAFLYFLIVMLFTTGVVSYIRRTDRMRINAKTVSADPGDMGLMKNACEQAVKSVENIVSALKQNHHADYDLVIAGAGAPGLSAALAAKKHNLRFIVLEQDTIELSVLNHLRTKLSGIIDLDLPLAGRITLKNASGQQLANMWQDLVIKYRIPVQENCTVQSVIPLNGFFNLTSSGNQSFSTAFVLLAAKPGSRESLISPGQTSVKHTTEHAILEVVNIQSY